MQSTELSLAGKLDTGLTKGICLLLGGLKTLSLWLLGFMTLATLPWLIFEYGEGLADLSRLEWIFIPLMILLLWRHVRYCQHFSTGAWLGLSRLLIFQGVMAVLYLIIIGLSMEVLVTTEYSQSFLEILWQDGPVNKLVSYGSVLLAAYLSAPTSGNVNASVSVGTTAHIEPTLNPATKEASL